MKKVLILTHDFPPYNSIGAQRPYSWHKYFLKFGIKPTVITRNWDSFSNDIGYVSNDNNQVVIDSPLLGKVIKVPYIMSIRDRLIAKYGFNRFAIIRRILSYLNLVARFFSFEFDSNKNIYYEAEREILNERYDLIIATGEPFIVFKYAHLLSKKFNIPWIADYRDGWNTHTGLRGKNILMSFVGFILYWFEEKYISSCRMITTVSEDLKDNLSNQFKKEVFIVTNGYDNDVVNDIILMNGSNNGNNFTITYAGSIYDEQRLEVFLDGFKLFTREIENNVILKFIGIESNQKQYNRLLSYDAEIQKYIYTTDRIPYKETLGIVIKSDVVLVLANENIDSSCTKIFDYIGLNKYVLVCVNDKGTLEEIINRTKSGDLVKNSDEVREILFEKYKIKKSGVEVRPNIINKDFYSRENQAKLLVELIKNKVLIK